MKIIANFFNSWWKPLVLTLFLFIIYFLGIKIRNHTINSHFPEFILTSILLILISIIVHLFNRKWKMAIFQLLIGIFYFFSLVIFLIGEPDFYADDLIIPKDISINRPLDFNSKKAVDSLNVIPFDNLKFELANSFQPGLYEYYLWYKPQEKGLVYLKAYEITKNDLLSEPRLSKRTQAVVLKNKSTLIHKRLTIYEGEWNYPYAARFEVWFKSEKDNVNKKLIEKNYIIEGWMR